MVHECPLPLRFGLHLLPLRIGLERGPILLPLLPARMLQNVDEQVLRTRRILGHPITDASHVVPLEDRVRVIAKASFESIHFPLVNVIQAQFVNVAWLFRIGSAKGAEPEHHCGAANKTQKITWFHIA